MAKGDVTVIDSQFTDRSMAFQVLAAAEIAEAGEDMPTILDKLKQIRDRALLVLGVTSFNNLVKGGRLSRVSGLISSFLNIKVVLQMEHGELKALRKGRGMKTINNFVTETISKMAKLTDIQSIGVSTAGAIKSVKISAALSRSLAQRPDSGSPQPIRSSQHIPGPVPLPSLITLINFKINLTGRRQRRLFLMTMVFG